jgi:hypothetical protein
MKNFKIEYRGHGVKYTAEYAATVSGALKVAAKKGWRVYDPSDPLNHCDTRPNQAWIYKRSGDSWERVALVTERGVETDDCRARGSYKEAMRLIEKATETIEDARKTMDDLNAIAKRSSKP